MYRRTSKAVVCRVFEAFAFMFDSKQLQTTPNMDICISVAAFSDARPHHATFTPHHYEQQTTLCLWDLTR